MWTITAPTVARLAQSEPEQSSGIGRLCKSQYVHNKHHVLAKGSPPLHLGQDDQCQRSMIDCVIASTNLSVICAGHLPEEKCRVVNMVSNRATWF